jgi:hypothetical protein
MPTELARWFRAEMEGVRAELYEVPPELAGIPWRTGGWTRKQIVGHMMDSAANNRQRFVRAAIDGRYSGPPYAQEAWVAAHGYTSQSWEKLLAWWSTEHEILAAVVGQIRAARLEASCVVGENAPVTLRFLIEDYVTHQQWHLKQIRSGATAL